MANLTLDVADPQILLHFGADPNGFTEHHRLLLCKLGPGRWVAASPDYDLEILDLNNRQHTVLGRRSPFPAHLVNVVYAFDPVPRNDLERLRRQAKTMSIVLGDEAREEVPAMVWIFWDPSSPIMGQLVPMDVMDEAVILGSRGILEVDGEAEWIEEIPQADVATFVEKRKGSLGDVRTLGNHTDSQNKRFISFTDAMPIMTQADLGDWGFKGPRAALEYLTSIKEGGSDLSSYHVQWLKTSGVNPKTSLVHEHRTLIEVLRLGICRDQLNPLNCMSFELVTRRLIQLEIAVSRSPSSPEFSGLDVLMENPLTESGAASTKAVDAWLTEQLKSRAQIQKQTRLYREEMSYGARDKGASAGADDGGSSWRSRKTKKAKAKPGASSGGAGAVDT